MAEFTYFLPLDRQDFARAYNLPREEGESKNIEFQNCIGEKVAS